jgi:mRNA interferase MazF
MERLSVLKSSSNSERYISEGLEISGVILADQVKSLDCQTRQAEFIGKISTEVLVEVISTITNLLG